MNSNEPIPLKETIGDGFLGPVIPFLLPCENAARKWAPDQHAGMFSTLGVSGEAKVKLVPRRSHTIGMGP